MFMSRIKPQVYPKFNPQLLPIGFDSVKNQPMVNSVGKKIQTALHEKGKTQRWLAEQIGVSDYAVTKWIKEGKISRENVGNLARILKMPTSEFIQGADQMSYKHPDPKINAMIKVMENMAEYQKDTLIKVSTALGESEESPGNGTK